MRPTLLVVDDERDVLRSVHDLLRIDYRVVTYQRGAEALEFLRSAESVHVILSDQRMPGMTGVEVLRQAKAIRPETTRLLFTAYTDIRTVIDAINQGHVFRYLAKPWDPDELEAVVRQAVEHHNLIVEKNRLLAELQETNARLIGGQPAQRGVHRGRQPRAQYAGHGGAGHDRALEDVARPERLAGGAPVGRPDRRRGRPAGPDRRADAQAGPKSGVQPVARQGARSTWSRWCGARSTSCHPISSCGARR